MASGEVQAGRRWPRRLQPSGTILSKGKGEEETSDGVGVGSGATTTTQGRTTALADQRGGLR